MSRDDDRRFMAMALSLGRRGQGRVWPNPAVGCVIVNAGRIVGRGWTADGGRPHAETRALAQAGRLAAGAVVYVTLEPCSHHGQTPPCAQALIDAGVARVVVALGDPDPRVSGRGVQMLRAAGITVDEGLCEEEARADHAGFLARVELGRPSVTLKIAASLDGRIATATGESKWITGPQARHVVHALRARHDAVLVGAGTVRADDPDLTVRGMGVERHPVRIVITRRLDLSQGSKLARTATGVPVWLCHGPESAERVTAWQALGVTCLPCPILAGQVDLDAALQALGDKGLTRVFCEGGGALAASLLAADLVDELIVFSAGIAIGAEGTPSLAAMGVDRLADAPRFRLVDLRAVDGDVMSRWSRRQRQSHGMEAKAP